MNEDTKINLTVLGFFAAAVTVASGLVYKNDQADKANDVILTQYFLANRETAAPKVIELEGVLGHKPYYVTMRRPGADGCGYVEGNPVSGTDANGAVHVNFVGVGTSIYRYICTPG